MVIAVRVREISDTKDDCFSTSGDATKNECFPHLKREEFKFCLNLSQTHAIRYLLPEF